MKCLCIIQARMGSKRFPGKALKKLSDLSTIEWVFKRVKKSKKINKIVLSTTKLKKDLQLIQIAKKNNISYFRGDNKNVLKRFYDTAKKYNPKLIVRVCADNPFVDPHMIDKLINKFNHKKFDYGFNHQSKLKNLCADGFGAEIFSFSLLKKLNITVKNFFLREHVTLYIWKNIKEFKIQPVYPSKGCLYPKLRFDINTKNDFKKLRNFISNNKIKLNYSAEKIIKLYLKS